MAAHEEQSRRSRTPCKAQLVLDGLEPDDRARLLAMIDSRQSPIAISAALDGFGIELHRDTIARHRKRGTASGCKCPR